MLVINEKYNRTFGLNFTVSKHPEPNTDQWVIKGVYSMYDKAIIQDIDVSTFNIIPADTSTFVDTITIDLENMQPITKGSTRVSLPFELHATYQDYGIFRIANDGEESEESVPSVILHTDSSYNLYYCYGTEYYKPFVSEFNLLTEDTEINILNGDALFIYGDATSFRNNRPIEFVNASGLYFGGNMDFLFHNYEITQDYACEGMFKNQTDTQTSKFPASSCIPCSSTLTVGCFKEMYMNCDVNDVGSDPFPAEYAPSYVCQSMFENCTKLTNTTTAYNMRNFVKRNIKSCGEYSFYRMFKGCTSLVGGAVPNVTTWGEKPFESMFEGCTSLKAVYCYFVGTLQEIRELFTDSDWIKDVNTTGTLHLKKELLQTAFHNYSEDVAKSVAKTMFSIPSNWNVSFETLT